MDKKLSVIIPIYNAEENLERCLESIMSQDFKKYEVILVNDGSTDSTEEICQKYVTLDGERFKYLRQNNSGPGASRNIGMDYASGEYLIFIDSDDTIEKGYFNDIVSIFEAWDGNVIQFGFNVCSPSLKLIQTRKSSNQMEIYGSSNIVYEYGMENKIDMFLWSKAFRRKSLLDHRFQPLYYAEDQLFLTEYFYRTEKILIVDRCYYNYVLSENSLVRSHFNKTKIDGIHSARKMYDLHKQESEKNVCFASEKLCYYISTMFVNLYSNSYEKKKLIEEFKHHYEILTNEDVLCVVSNKRKLLYFCFNYAPTVTSKLFNIRSFLKWG